MHKKIICILLAFNLLLPQLAWATQTGITGEKVHPCQQAWNDQMSLLEKEYQATLDKLLFQKKRTSEILDSQALGYNLRSYNCKLYQICEVVEKSLSPQKSAEETWVTGKMMRCEPVPVSTFGGFFQGCDNSVVTLSSDAFALAIKCKEQAEERIENSELIAEAIVIKSTATKSASNFVGYLMKLNKKINGLVIDMGDLIGVLFDVTRKMTCVQPSS